MSDTKIPGKTLNLTEKHHSDGSELIPAEVQANCQPDAASLPDKPLATGYTKDDEGLINNYAIEPDMSPSEYPSPQQQRRYIFLGGAAILFVVALVIIAFTVT